MCLPFSHEGALRLRRVDPRSRPPPAHQALHHPLPISRAFPTPSLRASLPARAPQAAALSLRDFPSLNASLSPDGGSLLQHGAVNIGVAMATPHGLAVPNIKGCQALSVAEIAAELARLQAAAAGNSLRAEDVAGGTFTLSNVGTLGGWWATPLVHPPQVRRAAGLWGARGRVQLHEARPFVEQAKEGMEERCT